MHQSRQPCTSARQPCTGGRQSSTVAKLPCTARPMHFRITCPDWIVFSLSSCISLVTDPLNQSCHYNVSLPGSTLTGFLSSFLLTRAWESDFVPPSKRINNSCLPPAARKMKKIPPKIWAWFLLSTCHNYYKRKPCNKYILPYSSKDALLQKSANLTPILCFWGTLLPAALLRCNAFSSPAPRMGLVSWMGLFILMSPRIGIVNLLSPLMSFINLSLYMVQFNVSSLLSRFMW